MLGPIWIPVSIASLPSDTTMLGELSFGGGFAWSRANVNAIVSKLGPGPQTLEGLVPKQYQLAARSILAHDVRVHVCHDGSVALRPRETLGHLREYIPIGRDNRISVTKITQRLAALQCVVPGTCFPWTDAAVTDAISWCQFPDVVVEGTDVYISSTPPRPVPPPRPLSILTPIPPKSRRSQHRPSQRVGSRRKVRLSTLRTTKVRDTSEDLLKWHFNPDLDPPKGFKPNQAEALALCHQIGADVPPMPEFQKSYESGKHYFTTMENFIKVEFINALTASDDQPKTELGNGSDCGPVADSELYRLAVYNGLWDEKLTKLGAVVVCGKAFGVIRKRKWVLEAHIVWKGNVPAGNTVVHITSENTKNATVRFDSLKPKKIELGEGFDCGPEGVRYGTLAEGGRLKVYNIEGKWDLPRPRLGAVVDCRGVFGEIRKWESQIVEAHVLWKGNAPVGDTVVSITSVNTKTATVRFDALSHFFRSSPWAYRLLNAEACTVPAPASAMDCRQKHAIKTFLEGESGVYLWQGPPGTGKSRTIAQLVVRLVQAGKKVLAVAHSNKAVDRLVDAMAREPTLTPVMNIRRIKKKKKKKEVFYRSTTKQLQQAKQVFLSTCAKSWDVAEVDVLIVDEAAFCPEVDLLISLRALHPRGKLLLVGDPAQLSPVVKSARRDPPYVAANVVVLSTAVSKFRPGSFLDNPRIACVGWSRQKPYLVVVGHAATLRQSPTWRPFIEMCESLKAFTKVSNQTVLRAMLPRP